MWCSLAGGCLLQGCVFASNNSPIVDPDLVYRAGFSFASDFAIFLLENLAASL